MSIKVGDRVLGQTSGEGTVVSVATVTSKLRRATLQEWALVDFDGEQFPQRVKTKYLTPLTVTVTLSAADAAAMKAALG